MTTGNSTILTGRSDSDRRRSLSRCARRRERLPKCWKSDAADVVVDEVGFQGVQ